MLDQILKRQWSNDVIYNESTNETATSKYVEKHQITDFMFL